MNENTASPRKPIYKRKGFWIGIGVLTLVGAIANGAHEKPSADTEAKPTATVTATPSPSSAADALKKIQEDNKKGQDDLSDAIAEASKSAAAAEEAVSSDVPDVVGMTNAEAIPALHAAGFMANEEDATGQGRWSLDNSNWKVCRQSPGSGNHPATLRVAIYSVKLNESC
jgi:hypothetical protein